ncbi:hypothetical protein A5668_13300 [Mycolicibacterium fortuitum]|nr:hypothetical protein A5668_13300 [Mycolicibacterium fortuitum]
MLWDVPDRRLSFAVGANPPADLPDAWAAAARAVTRDLQCRRHGRPISFGNVGWRFVVADEWVAVGFDSPDDANVGTYESCMGYLWKTSAAQALVWLADDVQDHLAGYEFVQWPIAGQHMLRAELVDDDAVWLDTGTNAVVARIGELCAATDQ